jgi:penicillin G amidase
MANWKNYIYKPVGVFGFFMSFVALVIFFLTWFESFYPFRMCVGYWFWIILFNFFILTAPPMVVYIVLGFRYFFKKKVSDTSNLNRVKTRADQRKYVVYVLLGVGFAFIISLTVFSFIFFIFTFYWSVGATYDPTIDLSGGRLSVNGSVVYIQKEQGTFAVKVSAFEDLDVMYGQGFSHAQLRYYQMDLNRRIGSGRVSEILGIEGLESDKFFKTLGLSHVASSILGQLDQDTKMALDAYANGVNDYIAKARAKPFELQIYNYPFESWSPLDSIICLKFYQWENSGNYLNELHRLRLLLDRKMTPKRVKEFFPPYPLNINETFHSFKASEFEEAQVTIEQNLKKENESFIQEEDNLVKEISMLTNISIPMKQETFMSMEDLNAGWSPSPLQSSTNKFNLYSLGSAFFGSLLTLDGYSIFSVSSNGPLTAPTEYMVMRLSGKQREAFGSSIPGVPGILNGRNDKGAWNVVPSNADVQDLYMMNETSATQYMYKNQVMNYTMRRETIKVKYSQLSFQYVEIMVRESVYGPVVSDVIKNSPQGVTLSLAWSARTSDKTMNWMWGAWRSSSFDSFRVLTQTHFESPPSSIFYGNNQENIQEPLFIIAGTIPRRIQGHTGMFPRVGSGIYDWLGNIPSYHHQRWPSQTHFVVGGARFVERGFRNIYGYDFDNEYAPKRLYEFGVKKIQSGTVLTSKELEDMLGDTMDLMVDDFKPILNQLRNDTRKSILTTWDKNCVLDSIACHVWRAWYWKLTTLPLNHVGVNYWDNHRYLISILNQNHSDCVTSTTKNCVEFAQQSLDSVDLSVKWSKLTPFQNVIMKSTAFDCFGTRYTYTGGSSSTLLQFSESNPSNKFVSIYGPTYKHVIDLEQSKDSYRWQYPLSNSGWQYQRYGEYDANLQNFNENAFFYVPTTGGKFPSFSAMTTMKITK